MKPHTLIGDLKVGDRFTLEREVEPDAVRASVEFGQDHGGYHVDEAFARAAGFRTVITSGVFYVTLIAALTGHINLLGREMTLALLRAHLCRRPTAGHGGGGRAESRAA